MTYFLLKNKLYQNHIERYAAENAKQSVPAPDVKSCHQQTCKQLGDAVGVSEKRHILKAADYKNSDNSISTVPKYVTTFGLFLPSGKQMNGKNLTNIVTPAITATSISEYFVSIIAVRLLSVGLGGLVELLSENHELKGDEHHRRDDEQIRAEDHEADDSCAHAEYHGQMLL